MPFTFSHPLFAAPLARLMPYLSLTGLVLGSMVPDMEYFMAMESHRTIGHTFKGFLLLGIPLSIAAAYAWHGVMKPVLPRLLPSLGGMDRYAEERLGSQGWNPGGLSGWIWFLIALFIGFLSHLFVDGMTHTGGWLVLREHALYRVERGLPLYKWLQYGLSALGLIIPALWLLADYARWLYRGGLRKEHRSPRRSKFAPRSAFVGAGMFLFMGKILLADRVDNIVLLLITVCSSFLFGIFVAGMLTAGRGRGLIYRISGLAMLLLLIAFFKIAQAAVEMSLHTNVAKLWVLYFWLFSLAIWLLSLLSLPRASKGGRDTRFPAGLTRNL